MFNNLDVQCLIYIMYIDIAFSKIREADFRSCKYLVKIVADLDQLI